MKEKDDGEDNLLENRAGRHGDGARAVRRHRPDQGICLRERERLDRQEHPLCRIRDDPDERQRQRRLLHRAVALHARCGNLSDERGGRSGGGHVVLLRRTRLRRVHVAQLLVRRKRHGRGQVPRGEPHPALVRQPGISPPRRPTARAPSSPPGRSARSRATCGARSTRARTRSPRDSRPSGSMRDQTPRRSPASRGSAAAWKIAKVDAQAGAGEQGDASLEGAEFAIVNASGTNSYVNGHSYADGETVMTIAASWDGLRPTPRRPRATRCRAAPTASWRRTLQKDTFPGTARSSSRSKTPARSSTFPATPCKTTRYAAACR